MRTYDSVKSTSFCISRRLVCERPNTAGALLALDAPDISSHGEGHWFSFPRSAPKRLLRYRPRSSLFPSPIPCCRRALLIQFPKTSLRALTSIGFARIRSGFWQQPNGWRLRCEGRSKIERGVCIIARSRSSIVKGLYGRGAPDLSKILSFLNRPTNNQAQRTKFEAGIRAKTIFVERSWHFPTY